MNRLQKTAKHGKINKTTPEWASGIHVETRAAEEPADRASHAPSSAPARGPPGACEEFKPSAPGSRTPEWACTVLELALPRRHCSTAWRVTQSCHPAGWGSCGYQTHLARWLLQPAWLIAAMSTVTPPDQPLEGFVVDDQFYFLWKIQDLTDVTDLSVILRYIPLFMYEKKIHSFSRWKNIHLWKRKDCLLHEHVFYIFAFY